MNGYKCDLKEYKDYLIIKNFSQATISAYSGALWQFFEYHQSHKMTFPYEQQQAKEYILFRYGQKLY